MFFIDTNNISCIWGGDKYFLKGKRKTVTHKCNGFSKGSEIVVGIGVGTVHAVDAADDAIEDDEQNANNDGDDGQNQTDQSQGVLHAGIAGLLHAQSTGDDTADGAAEGKKTTQAGAGAGAGQTQHQGNDTQNQGNDTQNLAGFSGRGGDTVYRNLLYYRITDRADAVLSQRGATFGTEHKDLPPFFM